MGLREQCECGLFERKGSVWPRSFGWSKNLRGPARPFSARAAVSFASVISILPRTSTELWVGAETRGSTEQARCLGTFPCDFLKCFKCFHGFGLFFPSGRPSGPVETQAGQAGATFTARVWYPPRGVILSEAGPQHCRFCRCWVLKRRISLTPFFGIGCRSAPFSHIRKEGEILRRTAGSE